VPHPLLLIGSPISHARAERRPPARCTPSSLLSRGNPYSSGPDKCRDENTLYLEELFGLNRCWGCKYVSTILGAFQRDTVPRVLDLGTGSCQMLRQLRDGGLDVMGVEAVSFPLEDKCQDLLDAQVVQKAQLDQLPFEDNSFDLVIATHVLEYLPRDALQGVLTEMRRVSRMRVVITVQLPDPSKPGLGGSHFGITPETLFPAGWWSEKLAANGLANMVSRQKMMMAAYKAHKVSGASAQDGMFALAKEPAADSPSGLLSLEPLCLACDYMPLVYYIYNPPGGVGKLINHRLYELGHVAVMSPTACNIIRGIEETRPSSLKAYSGFQMDPFTMERDCPELIYSGAVSAAPAPGQPLPGMADDSQDLVMLMHHLEAMDEAQARLALREAVRISRRHVFVLVMACGKTTLASECEARRHPWVKIVQPNVWWLKLFQEEGLEPQVLPHIFSERRCLPEEINPKFPDRTICPSWFEHFRFEGSSELSQRNIFALTKASAVAAPAPPRPPGARRVRPVNEAAPWAVAAIPPAPRQRLDPANIPLPKTQMGRGRQAAPPAPRSAMRGQAAGYTWKGVSQQSKKEEKKERGSRTKDMLAQEAYRANQGLGKRMRPDGGHAAVQERLLDKKMELEGSTEEHRQRRSERLDAAERARLIAQRGSDEELPIEEFMAKHGIHGGNMKSHAEHLEQQRQEAMPEHIKAAAAERERLANLPHKPFDLGSLKREFGDIKERHSDAPFPKHHLNFQARPGEGMQRHRPHGKR